MKSTASVIIFLSLLLVASVSANAAYVSNKLPPIKPFKGMYYDPTQSGSGLFVDVGANNTVFGLFSTFDNSGNQANLLTAGTVFTPSSETDRLATGIIGTASGQFYKVTGGQCPGCPFTPATTTGVPIFPTFTWYTNRRVVMEFDGHSYNMLGTNYETGTPAGDEEFLHGTFSVNLVEDDTTLGGSSNVLPTSVAIMRGVPAPFTTVTLASGSSSNVHLPPAGAHLYVLQCAGSQDGTDPKACANVSTVFSLMTATADGLPLMWFDPATSTSGFTIYRPQAGGAAVIGPATADGTLYVSPDELQVHLQLHGQIAVSAAHDGDVDLAVTLTKVPDVTVRTCYDFTPTNACH